ncbi:hypothetical protein Btru_071854 [Bulinus truncatus]|nr:hypothetical protein Btru_071854 [Bulinus truncatus]
MILTEIGIGKYTSEQVMDQIEKGVPNEKTKENDCFHGLKHGRYFDLQDARTTLPIKYRQEDLINTIQAVEQLTVKVQQTSVAGFKQHKKCLPLTSSGFIKYIRKVDDPCCCFKCKNATAPSVSCAVVEINTASHAVPLKKPESILCTLFYDGSSKQKTTLRVAKVIDKGSDLCILQCIICDNELIFRLETILHVYQMTSLKLHNIYEKVPDEEKVVFIVSHPHGWPKKVSFGHLLMDETMPDASAFLSYSNTTCVGSSGSLVFIAGYNSWAVHIGSRVCSITGVNVGFGRPENIYDCNNYVEIERQIQLEAAPANLDVRVNFLNPKTHSVCRISLRIENEHGEDYTVEEEIIVPESRKSIIDLIEYLNDPSVRLTLIQYEQSLQTNNSVVTDNPAETPVVIEDADKPAETPVVIEDADKPAETPVVIEDADKPAETPVVIEDADKPAETPLPFNYTLEGNEMIQGFTIHQNKKDDSPEAKLLRSKYTIIIKTIEAKYLIDKAFEKGLIERFQQEEIESILTRRGRNRKFLHIVFDGCPEAFYLFKKILLEVYPDLVDEHLNFKETRNKNEKNGGPEWWSRKVVRKGGPEWWSGIVVKSGGPEWWSGMVVRNGGQEWWS